MDLRKKKELAAKTLGVGKARIVFNGERLDEIKEAITKQDIRDLHAGGAIMIREIRGTKRVERRKGRRRTGSIRKKVNMRKREYMALTRKLRAYLNELRRKEKLSEESYALLRKEIKSKAFKDKTHLKERMKELGVK